jgi:hypothetical protein
MLGASNPTALRDIDYPFPAMHYTQNDLSSSYRQEWQSPTTEFEQQQQTFQTQQQDMPEGAFPNAFDTSAHGDTSFDWPKTRQVSLETAGNIADRLTDSLAFRQTEPRGVSFFL